jgi:hypothetical protein
VRSVKDDESHVVVHPDTCNAESPICACGTKGRLLRRSNFWSHGIEIRSEVSSEDVKRLPDALPFPERGGRHLFQVDFLRSIALRRRLPRRTEASRHGHNATGRDKSRPHRRGLAMAHISRPFASRCSSPCLVPFYYSPFPGKVLRCKVARSAQQKHKMVIGSESRIGISLPHLAAINVIRGSSHGIGIVERPSRRTLCPQVILHTSPSR